MGPILTVDLGGDVSMPGRSPATTRQTEGTEGHTI
jgi:hypothetical protein